MVDVGEDGDVLWRGWVSGWRDMAGARDVRGCFGWGLRMSERTWWLIDYRLLL